MGLYLGKKKLCSYDYKTNKKYSMKMFFSAGGKFQNLTVSSMDGWFNKEDTADMTTMANMFSGCSNLTSAPQMDMSKVTNMSGMFHTCSSLTSVPEMNTSKVTNMSNTFYQCLSLTSIPALDTSNVVSMYNTFFGCTKLTSLPAMDMSKVVDTSNMLYQCSSLTAIHMYGMKVKFDISASTKFTREALVEILNNLGTVTSTTTLTMGSTNKAKLTDDDIAIATAKGWSIS